MSFGVGPFATNGLGSALPTYPSEPRTTLSSSRKIDPETGAYVLNDDGGFEAMDDVAQRVYLAICFGVEGPPIIDARFQATMQAAIRKALEPLTKGRKPAIKIIAVNVTDDGRETTLKEVVYRNLLTNTNTTVQAN